MPNIRIKYYYYYNLLQLLVQVILSGAVRYEMYNDYWDSVCIAANNSCGYVCNLSNCERKGIQIRDLCDTVAAQKPTEL